MDVSGTKVATAAKAGKAAPGMMQQMAVTKKISVKYFARLNSPKAIRPRSAIHDRGVREV